MRKQKNILAYPYVIWVIFSIIAPILLVIYYSFIDDQGILSFSNFQQAFSFKYLVVFMRSMKMAAITTGLCLLIGYPVAWSLSKIKHKNQKMLLFLFILPTWTNIILRTYAWMAMFYKNGLIDQLLQTIGITSHLQYSEFAIYLGMVYNFLPFMILPLYTAITKIDKSLIEASTDLGATVWQQQKTVVLPLALPGILSGIIMVFLPAATTFVIPQLLGGGKYSLIGNVIERQFLSADNVHFGSALSILLIILILISIFILDRLDKKSYERGH